MTAKKHLQEIRRLDRKIENKKMELASMYELAQSVTATIKEFPVSASGDQDRLGATVAKIVDLQNEISADIENCAERKMDAIRMIDEIGNDEYINILVRRYVRYETWAKIADDLHYSRQAIDRKHGLALLEFQKLLTEFDAN